MTRRVQVALGPRGGLAGEQATGFLHHGDSAAAALGMWAYHNRDSLGIEVELITAKGRAVSSPQSSGR